MPALDPGTKAPQIKLSNSSRQDFDLSRSLHDHPLVVLVFFKVGCPTCQFTFPYLERLHRSYPALQILGVSQDDADATTAFTRMFGVTFPVLLDVDLQATVQYGLTNVPSLFLIDKDLKIQQTVIGFDKAALEQLNQTLSTTASLTAVPLFTAADEVPDLKPG